MYYALHSIYKINMSGELKRYHFINIAYYTVSYTLQQLVIVYWYVKQESHKTLRYSKRQRKKNDKNNVLCSLDFSPSFYHSKKHLVVTSSSQHLITGTCVALGQVWRYWYNNICELKGFLYSLASEEEDLSPWFNTYLLICI